MKEPLVEADGENRAVRGFLLGLECGNRTFTGMRTHMTHYGTPYWPDHFAAAQGHITKYEQQEWLRHLFNLENKSEDTATES
jgi:hypothetical protein